MTTYINIISGFLGAGKTTFLKKLIPNMEGKIALIENEFGDVSVDGDLMEDGFPIREIYAGCICCSVAGDFKRAIEELVLEHKPGHILIEPSGVASLSDIIKVCKKTEENLNLDIRLNHLITIVDASSFEEYLDNFGSFYLDQIQNSHMIFLSHLEEIEHEERERVISNIRLNNETAIIFEEDWYHNDGKRIIEVLDSVKSCEFAVKEDNLLMPANKKFSTLSVNKPKVFSQEDINDTLGLLKNKEFGFILRAKGIVQLNTNQYINFNFTPNYYSWEYLGESKDTKVAVIGSQLNKDKILKLFKK